jgi:hydrogenase maturation protease
VARPLLVLGLGNVLCGDDGAGVIAVEALARGWRTPPGVTILDGGTLGLSLLGLLCDARAAILVDAIAQPGAAPGTLVRLGGDEALLAVGQRLSPHQVGVADLLAAARLLDRCPDPLVLVGVVPSTLDAGLGCSPAVCAAIPGLVGMVADECRALGHELAPVEAAA